MNNLKGKVALITGGTSGIGRETAVTLAKAGAQVVVTGRREKEGQETVGLIEAAGGEGFYVQTDVKNESDIKRAVEEAVSRYGKLDIAINNAAIELSGPILDTTHESFETLFNINVWGVIASLKHEIPALLQNGGGSIVNISSVAGRRGMAGLSVYAASKHAVEGLTKAAALEFAREGVRINAVAPAVIDTDMPDRALGKKGEVSRDQITALHPIGRSGKPYEVANAILWLVGDESSFVTGQSLGVDGGWMAQ
ncbi:MAG: short chain dehydrogenase [Verrucomicrobiales bacterium]|nr:short chain dehydrogenase [Verrucomicrobiales bacterium]